MQCRSKIEIKIKMQKWKLNKRNKIKTTAKIMSIREKKNAVETYML